MFLHSRLWFCSLETRKFVEITAQTFALRPGLLQDLNLLLGLNTSHISRLFISPNEIEVSTVVLKESSGSQILPVSPAARSLPGVITSSKDVRDILTSQDPSTKLLNLDSLWVPSVMQLLQLVRSPLTDLVVLTRLLQELENASDSDYCKKCMKCLRSMVKKHQILPPSFLFNNIVREGTNPVWGGGFAVGV